MSIEDMQIPTLSNADQDSKKWKQLSEEVEVGSYDFEAFKDEESYQNKNEISEDQLRQAKERFAAEVQQKRGKGVLGFIRRRIA
jgi:hypothetical protein